MSNQSKYKLRSDLVNIGRQAVEHALQALSQDDPTRKIVEKRLMALGNGDDLRKTIKSIKPETEYNRDSCLRRASAELLKLAISERWPSGGTLTGQIFVPCWDSFIFVSDQEMRREMGWQDKTLYPMIERAFEQVRASKNKSAA